jgi:hypothetical protein
MRLRHALLCATALAVAAPAPARAEPISTAIGLTAAISSLGVGASFAGAIGGALITTGLSLGASLLTSALAPKPKLGDVLTGIETTVQIGGDVAREVPVGTLLLKGQLAYQNTGGANNELYERVFVLSDWISDGLLSVVINGKKCGLTQVDSGPTGARYTVPEHPGVITLAFYNGTQTTADGTLIARSNGRWAESDVFDGMSYVAAFLTYKKDAPLWENGIPELAFEGRWAKLYDWRKDSTNGGSGPHRWGDLSTYEYSDNPVVVSYNYHRGFYDRSGELILGQGVAPYDILHETYTAAANVCDETVTLDDGGSEKRYRCATVLSADDGVTHKATLDVLRSTFAGQLDDYAGSYFCQAGAAQVPVATITDAELVVDAPVAFAAKRSRADLVNRIHGQFLDATDLYQSKSYGAQVDAGATANDGEELGRPLDLLSVPSRTQAERIAKVRLREARAQATATITLGFHRVWFQVGDWITWVSSGPAGARTWRIVRKRLDAISKAVTLELEETNASVYSWTAADESVAPAGPIRLETGNRISTVSGFGLQAVTQASDNGATQVPALRCFWTPVADDTVDAVVVEHRPVGASAAARVVDPSPGDGEIIIPGVVPVAAYEARASIITTPARPVTWTAWTQITTESLVLSFEALDSTPPSVPTGLAVSSTTQRMPSGEIVSIVTATCSASPSSNFGSFEFEASRNGGAFFGQTSTTPGATWTEFKPGDSVVVRVKALSKVGFPSLYLTAPAHTVAANTSPPGAPTALTADVGLRQVVLTATPPTDSDLDGLQLWEGTSNNRALALPVQFSDGTMFSRVIPPGQTRYYAVVARNTSGIYGAFYPASTTGMIAVTVPRAVADDLADAAVEVNKLAAGLEIPISVAVLPHKTADAAAYAALRSLVYLTTDKKLYRKDAAAANGWTASVPTTDLSGTITGPQIAAQAIDLTKFASGITPVENVSALPTTGNFEGRTVTFGGKLYRYTGGAFTASVPTTDLTGTVTGPQIAAAAVDLTKLANGLTAIEIVGALPTTGNFEGRTVNFGGKLYRYTSGAFTASVPTTDLSGTVTGSQIAAAAIDQTKFASGIQPIGVIASTAAAHVTGIDTALNSADGKLYRWSGSAWVRSLDAADITVGTLSSAQIADLDAAKLTGLIAQNRITDGSISTPKLAAGAVVADKLAASAVTAGKLAVGTGQQNLVINGEFEDGMTGWSISAGAAGIDPSTYFSGTSALGLARNAGGVGVGSNAVVSSTRFPVGAGEVLELGCWAIPLGVGSSAGGFYLGLVFFDAAGGYIIYSAAASNYALPLGWSRVSGQITAPANALKASVQINVENTYAGQFLNVDQVVCRRAASATFIEDGAITTPKITVNSLNGDRIQAGTMSATKLIAGSITAGLIAAGAIGTSQLAAGAVTAGKLLIAAVDSTTGNLAPGAVNASTVIADGVITTPKILVNSLNGDRITVGTLNADKLIANSITASQVAAGAIGTTQLAAGAVTAGKLLIAAVDSTGNLTPGAVNASTVIADGVITTSKIFANSLNGDRIQAGTLAATKLVADSITAAQIAVGAIGADEIAANAITASKLAVGTGLANLVINGEFEDGNAGWTSSNSSLFGIDTGTYFSGSKAGSLDRSSGTITASSNYFNVGAGEVLEVSGWFVPLGTTSTQGTSLTIHFYTTSFGYAGNVPIAANVGLSAGWQQLIGQATVPANAAHAIVEITNASTSENRWVNFDQITCRRAGGATFIKDGSILTAKIAANQIVSTHIAVGTLSGDRITAASMNADRLQAGTITTGLLGANVVVASKLAIAAVDSSGNLAAGAATSTVIADGAVLTNKIGANQIVTSHMQAGTINADRLTAASVTAVQLAADSVTAGKIAAGAITASKLAVGTYFANTVVGGDFEDGTLGPFFGPNTGYGGVGVDPSQSFSGSKCVALDRGTNVSGTAWSWLLTSPSSNIPVGPGEAWEVAAYFKGSGNSAAGIAFYVAFNDVSGNYMGQTAAIFGGAITTTWTKRAAQIIPPLGCASIAINIIHDTTSTARYLWVDGISARKASGATLIEDGAIGTSKVALGAINRERIGVAAIGTTEIENGVITTDKIAANAITAGKLVTDQAVVTQTAQLSDAIITTAKIGDAQITTAKIGDAQINSAKIGDLQVNSAKIADLTVGNTKITDNAVTNSKYAAANGQNVTAAAITLRSNARVQVELTLEGSSSMPFVGSLPTLTLTIRDVTSGSRDVATMTVPVAAIGTGLMIVCPCTLLCEDTGYTPGSRIYRGNIGADSMNMKIKITELAK